MTNYKKLTHTNSDKECLRENANVFRKTLYILDTHNGFKFFNPTERTACHAFVWLVATLFLVYGYVFCRGFYDGIHVQMETRSS